jgi:hypothetical protein
VYLALYLIYNNSGQFGVLWGLKMHARLQFAANTTVINSEVKIKTPTPKQYIDFFLFSFYYDFQNIRAVTSYLWCNSFRCLWEEKSANSWLHTSELQASDFESDENYFRGFLHRYSFPYFLTCFMTDFLHIWHADYNGKHLSYFNKTNYIFGYSDFQI